jgi:photosystem II stability/assembly factor-like uncharacterized protein
MSAAQTTPGWSWLHPTPQGNPVRWVKVFDANIWYVFGNSGLFAKTPNAGATWNFQNNVGTQYSTGRYSDNYAAWFFDQATGFVGGSGRNLLRTTNGGAAWARIATEPNAVAGQAGLNNSLAPFDTTHIWFGTTAGTVYRSTDAGLTWTFSSATGITAEVDELAFNGPLNGVAGGQDAASRTTNGGATWTAINIGGSGYVLGLSTTGNEQTCGLLQLAMERAQPIRQSSRNGRVLLSHRSEAGGWRVSVHELEEDATHQMILVRVTPLLSSGVASQMMA